MNLMPELDDCMLSWVCSVIQLRFQISSEVDDGDYSLWNLRSFSFYFVPFSNEWQQQ